VRAPLDLVIGETRVPLTQSVTLGRADSNDQIKNTVDYVSVAELVLQVSSKQQFSTLEKLAATIAEEVLIRHKLVQNVWISLAKPLPPAAIVAETVGVELERSRE